MSHVGQNSKVPIRIQEICLQIILKFAKCGPPCEGRGKWIVDYGILAVRTDAHDLCAVPSWITRHMRCISISLPCLLGQLDTNVYIHHHLPTVPSPHTLTRTEIVWFALDVQYVSYCINTPCVSLPCLESNFLRCFTCALDRFDPSRVRAPKGPSQSICVLSCF